MMLKRRKISYLTCIVLTAIIMLSSFSATAFASTEAEETGMDTSTGENGSDILDSLIDYSYAGYKGGLEEIPTYDLNTYVDFLEYSESVQDYLSDDELRKLPDGVVIFKISYEEGVSDYTDILNKAISNATTYINGSDTRTAIILFDAATYKLATTKAIEIATSNIILKGTTVEGVRTKLVFTGNVAGDGDSHGYFINIGNFPEIEKKVPTPTNELFSSVTLQAETFNEVSVRNEKNETTGDKCYIKFQKKGSTEIYVSRSSKFSKREIEEAYINGSMIIKQIIPSVKNTNVSRDNSKYQHWVYYEDKNGSTGSDILDTSDAEGIGAIKTMIYGAQEDSDGKYYEMCNQLRDEMTAEKSVYEYHTIKSIIYDETKSNESGEYVYKIVLNEPLKMNYLDGSSIVLYGSEARFQYKNIGIEDIDFSCSSEWVANYNPSTNEELLPSFNHAASVLESVNGKPAYYGYYGIFCENVMDLWIKNAGFENFVQGVEFTDCFRVTADNLKFSGVYTHHSVYVDSSTDCLVANLYDNDQLWHSPTVGNSAAGTVFLNCEFPAESCPDLHSATPFATLFDNCSGGFEFSHHGGTMSRMPSHFADFVMWNYENRSGVMETLDVWAFNSYKSPLIHGVTDYEYDYDNHTFWMTPIFVGIQGQELTFDERDLYYYQKELPVDNAGNTINSLYIYQLNNRISKNNMGESASANAILNHWQKTYNVLHNDNRLENVENLNVNNVSMDEYTLTWEKVDSPNNQDVNYLIYYYNSEKNKWETYRDTATMKETLTDGEGTCSVTFGFWAPTSNRKMTVRAYQQHEYQIEGTKRYYRVYSEYAESVEMQPKVTGLDVKKGEDNNYYLVWDTPVNNFDGYTLTYKIAAADPGLENWTDIGTTDECSYKLEYSEETRYKVRAVWQKEGVAEYIECGDSEEITVAVKPQIESIDVKYDTESGGFTISWDAVENLGPDNYDIHYIVYRENKDEEWESYRNTEGEKTSNNIENVIDDITGKVTYQMYINFFDPGTETRFSVKAFAKNKQTGEKIYGDYLETETITCPALTEVQNLKMTSKEGGAVISWTDNTEIVGEYYKIYKYNTANGVYECEADIYPDGSTNLSFTVNDLEEGEIRSYGVSMAYKSKLSKDEEGNYKELEGKRSIIDVWEKKIYILNLNVQNPGEQTVSANAVSGSTSDEQVVVTGTGINHLGNIVIELDSVSAYVDGKLYLPLSFLKTTMGISELDVTKDAENNLSEINFNYGSNISVTISGNQITKKYGETDEFTSGMYANCTFKNNDNAIVMMSARDIAYFMGCSIKVLDSGYVIIYPSELFNDLSDDLLEEEFNKMISN